MIISPGVSGLNAKSIVANQSEPTPAVSVDFFETISSESETGEKGKSVVVRMHWFLS